MKGLRFRQGEFNFLVDIEYVLHIDDYFEVKNELEDIEVFNFQEIFNTGELPSEIIFIGKGKSVKGIRVEQALGVFQVKDIVPLGKGVLMIDFIDTITKDSGEVFYIIDPQKIIGVNYEEKSPSD